METNRPVPRVAVNSARRAIANPHTLVSVGAFAGLAGGLIGIVRPDFPATAFLAGAALIVTCHLLSGFVARKLAGATAAVLRAAIPPRQAPVGDVTVGDLVRVVAGEVVPADGLVVGGASVVSQAPVTGQPIPRETVAGDTVIAGSVNQTGTLLVRVTRAADDRVPARPADGGPGSCLLLDRVLAFYAPAVLVVAAAAFGFWTLGSLLLFGHADPARAVFAMLTVALIGYPCALASTGTLAMLRAAGWAAQRGILVRGIAVFERLAKIDRIVLDKTGTLTQSAPFVVAAIPASGVTTADLLRTAAAVESRSEHPLARAVVDRARADGLDLPPVSGFRTLPGRGVRGTVGGHDDVIVGSPAAAVDAAVELGELTHHAETLQAQGRTVVVVLAARRPLGLIGIAAPVKPCAAATVTQLRQRGVEPVMLTGDGARTAQLVAEQVGITESFAQVLPEDKTVHVQRLQHAGHRVAMVGDGSNDAPALRQADVGIAIGSSTDTARASADVILLGPRTAAVLDAHDLARRCAALVTQNVVITFALNGFGVLAAATGLLHPGWVIAAMAASVTAVLVNTFRRDTATPGAWRRFADLAEPTRPDPNKADITGQGAPR